VLRACRDKEGRLIKTVMDRVFHALLIFAMVRANELTSAGGPVPDSS
jgi:hypothetical protein